MTGRGRGRLLKDLRNNAEGSYAPTTTADLKDLFNGPRSQNEVYKILKTNILDAPFSHNKLRSCLESIIENMIKDSTNSIEICKYLYVCSCSAVRTIGSEVWSQFFKVLESKFKEIHSKGDQNNEDALHNFIKFFIVAIHFMRNLNDPPKDDIISAILIMIERLNKSSNDDINLYCQSVAWMSSYMQTPGEGSVLMQAYSEAVVQLREWVLDGSGGHWALACLETACSGGLLPTQARGYYSKTLPRSQYSSLTETLHNVLIPASDKRNFNLPNLQSINYID